MYGDLLYYILFCALTVVGFMILQAKEKQPINNIFISCGIMSLIMFVARSIQYVKEGTTLYLITDYHMWVFGVITILSAGILWATKEKGA